MVTGSRKRAAVLALFLLLVLFLSGCREAGKKEAREGPVTVVFKHGKIAGGPEGLRRLLDLFEKENPGIRVVDESLPSSTDEQHQFYVINLEGRSTSFDVLSMDVIWVPEFARAGWLLDLSGFVPEEERKGFFPGPMAAVTYRGRIYAVPWYIDAGLLYYRKDLLERYGLRPPKTWEELVETAGFVTEREKGLYGFVWQGKQYEGLICNVLEYMWSAGGGVLEGERARLLGPENVRALSFMRDLIVRYRVSPPLVTTATEEPTRHIFGSGRAVFMRNWPYAWNIFNRDGSPVKGKVGVTLLPAFRGHEPASTLGGWQLGVNRFSTHTEEAARLVAFLTSARIQKKLALTVGYKPTRKALYRDRDLRAQAPFMAGLYTVFMKARPRPVTPYYMMMSQVLQPEFSAAITGIKSPEEALRDAEALVNHILEIEG